ncbi:hypothetical protein HFN89_03170 [Rhizobium laguerreae]|nr:hypothetical protein [Rhizobium laguerreae]
MLGVDGAPEILRGVFQGFAAACLGNSVPQFLRDRWWTGRRWLWRYFIGFRNVHFLAFDGAVRAAQNQITSLFWSDIKTPIC